MASTSTNKAPLLVDRPLLVIERLDRTSTPAGSADPGSGTSAVLLVDCVNNDGALVESINLIQRVAGDTSVVNLYLSSSAQVLGSDGYFLARANFAGGGDPGTQIAFQLFPLLAPVPHAGENDGTTDAIPLFRGLRIGRGMALWAAVNSVTPVANAPSILVQGGYY